MTALVTLPILLPLVTAIGYDPIFFGVIVIIVVEIGLVTPPFGLISFIVAKTARRPVAEVFRGIWPHFVAHILAIILLCAFPQLVLWLPSQM